MKERLVVLRGVDREAYNALQEAVLEINRDISGIYSKTASAEDRVISQMSILDDLEHFSSVYGDASKSYRQKTGQYLAEVPGLKRRDTKLKFSRLIYRAMEEIRADDRARK